MNKVRCIALIITLLHLCPIALGSTKQHLKLWTGLETTGSMGTNKRLNYFIEPQVRFIDNRYKLDEINLYLGGYYIVNDRLKAWLGVFRQYDQTSSGPIENQDRLWEQITWRFYDSNKFSLSSRSRLEQRRESNTSGIANRLRQRFTLKVPLSETSKNTFILGDEIYIQLNKPNWTSSKTLSQNRAAIGFEIQLDNHLFYEIGYLNQFLFNDTNQMSNVIYTSINIDIPDDY